MAVSVATYIKDLSLLIRDSLITGMTDPISGRASGHFVMTSYPLKRVTYPVITVVASGATGAKRLGMRSNEMYGVVPVEIRVWARSAEEKDLLTQQVHQVLRTIQLTASTGTVANEAFGFVIASTTDVDETDGEGTGIAIRSKITNVEYTVILA